MKKIMFSDKYLLTLAVLNGSKTMTRRLLKVPKTCNGKEVYSFNVLTNNAGTQCVDLVDENGGVLGSWEPHYEVGDIVAIAQPYKDIIERLPMYSNAILDEVGMPRKEFKAGWTNKMFVRAELMPHHIRITDVKVERLQDISEEDCLKEGIIFIESLSATGEDAYFFAVKRKVGQMYDNILKFFSSPQRAYADLIDKISGKGTWESNPLVVAYNFELVDSSMDELMKPADIQLYAKPFLYKKLYYDDFCEVKRKCKSRAGSTPYACKRKKKRKK